MTMTLETPTGAVDAGDDVDATIHISTGETEVYAYQTTVMFDPGVVSTVYVQEGDFLNGDGTQTFQVISMGGPGEITIANTRMIVATGVAGTGDLLTIRFNAVAPGSPSIEIASAVLLDANLQPIVF